MHRRLHFFAFVAWSDLRIVSEILIEEDHSVGGLAGSGGMEGTLLTCDPHRSGCGARRHRNHEFFFRHPPNFITVDKKSSARALLIEELLILQQGFQFG